MLFYYLYMYIDLVLYVFITIVIYVFLFFYYSYYFVWRREGESPEAASKQEHPTCIQKYTLYLRNNSGGRLHTGAPYLYKKKHSFWRKKRQRPPAHRSTLLVCHTANLHLHIVNPYLHMHIINLHLPGHGEWHTTKPV